MPGTAEVTTLRTASTISEIEVPAARALASSTPTYTAKPRICAGFWGLSGIPIFYRLASDAVETVTRITESGNDVSVLVEFFVQCAKDESDVTVSNGFLDSSNPLG